MPNRRLLLSVVLVAVSSIGNATAVELERLLIPLYVPESVPVVGAFGSRWATEVVIRNEDDVPAVIFQNVCVYECRPPIPTTACGRGEPTPPQARYSALIASDESRVNRGVFLNVEKDRAVTVGVRLRELSRGAVESGVEIPVVREHDLVSGTVWLSNVPSQPAASRVHLRVYFVAAPVPNATVSVRVYRGDSNSASAELVIPSIGSSDAGGVPPPDGECVGTPAFNMVDLTPYLDAAAGFVRVRIDSLTEGLRYWPMISVTSNATQYVTLVTPQ